MKCKDCKNKAVPGYLRCPECIDKANARQREWYHKNKEKRKAQIMARQRRLREEGKCRQCGGPSQGYSCCTTCQERINLTTMHGKGTCSHKRHDPTVLYPGGSYEAFNTRDTE